MTLRGIDVSSNQGTIDWSKASVGLDFAIARCVREVGTVDDQFAANIAGARKYNLVPGAYCFLNEGTAAAQAQLSVDAIKAQGVDMLVILDLETGSGVLPSINDVRTWTAIVRNAFPAQPILIYGSPGVIDVRGSLAGWGPWWRADYGTNPAGTWDAAYAARGGDAAAVWTGDASGWTGATIWQFSSKGVIPGIAGDVDLDATKLTRRALEILAGSVAAESDLDAANAALASVTAERDDLHAEVQSLTAANAELQGQLNVAPMKEQERIAAAFGEQEAERIRQI